MENPFQFGRELGSEELINRREEVAEVISAVTGARKLFVIGPRRFGKTSILKAASDQVKRRSVTVLRYNAEAYQTLDQFAGAIITDAAKSMLGGVERAGEQIKKYFSKLRPELSFNVTEAAWGVKLGVAPSGSENTQVKLLVDALNGLEKMSADQPAGRSTGLIIDEFQKVIEIGGSVAEAQIRAAIQQHKRTGYVFAGSKTRMLTDMTTDASRPFYRLGSLLFVGPLPREEFSKFLLDSFESGGYITSGAAGALAAGSAVDLILELSEDVPYNVQLLAHTCWEFLQGAKKSHLITEKVVCDALDRIVRRYDPFYTQLWTQLTAVQQKTLLAMTATDGMNMRSNGVARMVGKAASTIQSALNSLSDRDIIRDEEQAGALRFRFEDPFFAAWIKTFVAKL